jgi:hypothetical protein
VGPVALGRPTAPTSVENNDAPTALQAHVDRVQHPTAVRFSVTWNPVNMLAAQALRAVVADHSTARLDHGLTVQADKALIPVDRVAAHLRIARAGQEPTNQAPSIQAIDWPKTPRLCERLRCTSSLHIPIQQTAERLDLAARAGLLEPGF